MEITNNEIYLDLLVYIISEDVKAYVHLSNIFKNVVNLGRIL